MTSNPMTILDKKEWEYPLPIVEIGLKLIRENPDKNFVELMRVFGIDYHYLKGNSQMMYNFLKEVDKVNGNFISKKDNHLHLWLDGLLDEGYNFTLYADYDFVDDYHSTTYEFVIYDETGKEVVSMDFNYELPTDFKEWFKAWNG